MDLNFPSGRKMLSFFQLLLLTPVIFASGGPLQDGTPQSRPHSRKVIYSSRGELIFPWPPRTTLPAKSQDPSTLDNSVPTAIAFAPPSPSTIEVPPEPQSPITSDKNHPETVTFARPSTLSVETSPKPQDTPASDNNIVVTVTNGNHIVTITAQLMAPAIAPTSEVETETRLQPTSTKVVTVTRTGPLIIRTITPTPVVRVETSLNVTSTEVVSVTVTKTDIPLIAQTSVSPAWGMYPYSREHDKRPNRRNHAYWKDGIIWGNAYCGHIEPAYRGANIPFEAYLGNDCAQFIHGTRRGDAPWSLNCARIKDQPEGRQYKVYMDLYRWDDGEHCRAGCETCFDAMEEYGVREAMCFRSTNYAQCRMGIVMMEEEHPYYIKEHPGRTIYYSSDFEPPGGE